MTCHNQHQGISHCDNSTKHLTHTTHTTKKLLCHSSIDHRHFPASTFKKPRTISKTSFVYNIATAKGHVYTAQPGHWVPYLTAASTTPSNWPTGNTALLQWKAPLHRQGQVTRFKMPAINPMLYCNLQHAAAPPYRCNKRKLQQTEMPSQSTTFQPIDWNVIQQSA